MSNNWRLTRREFLKLLGLAAGSALLGPRPRPGAASETKVATGIVFHDADGDGRFSSGDKGLGGVLVSDGLNVVQTDSEGQFELPLSEHGHGVVFITTPSGWQAERFYHHLRPEDDLPEFQFPLQPGPNPKGFTFIQVTDIHIMRQAVPAVEQFVEVANKLQPDFVISTGDLVMDVCEFTKQADTFAEVEEAFAIYDEAMAGLQPPLFEVIGNHDCACALPPDLPEYYKGAYRKLYGPLWYSFGYGEWHFVVLDGNAPQPPPVEWLNKAELVWIANDLSFQPPDRPIIIFSHQPAFTCEHYTDLIEAIQGYNVVVALAGHWHANWEHRVGILNIVTGALSGRWWGRDGVHWNGQNPDGSPQGFRICQVEGERFSSEYVSMKSQL